MIEIVPDDAWKTETQPYLPRIEAAITLSGRLQDELLHQWPGRHFPGPAVSKASNLAILIGAYASSVFSVAFQSCAEVKRLWEAGQFVLVPLVVRYVYESWGAVHFSKSTLDRLISEEDVAREEKRVTRLTFGARTNDLKLPDGRYATEKSFSVMTFIRSLVEVGESEDTYSFLSEACHPSMVQSKYFQLAGPPLANWRNANYKAHGHELLERMTRIIESTCSGLQSDLFAILESGRIYVETKG